MLIIPFYILISLFLRNTLQSLYLLQSIALLMVKTLQITANIFFKIQFNNSFIMVFKILLI